MSQDSLLSQVSEFIYREARYQDEHEYDAWQSLWTDDGVYWVPANGDDIDPDTQMSIIYDNRSRIALRIRQFHTGKRHTQMPKSRLRRLISNIEIESTAVSDVKVAANVLIFESSLRGETLWAARTYYHLRRDTEGFRMAQKKSRPREQ